RQDISGPLTTLKHLISSPEIIRANMLNVDVSFSGYDNTREELFEIPEVRNYVYALDAQFPFWLYFLSRYFMGLQCLAYCHLLPYLTPEAQAKSHPQKLADLIDNRWGPALWQLCSSAGHIETEADALLESAMNYFSAGPTKLVDESNEEDFSDQFESDLIPFKAEDEHVRDKLLLACRVILRRPELAPRQIVAIGGFIWLLQQLPFFQEEPSGHIALVIYSNETDWSSFDLTLNEEGLTLETMESFNTGHGTDHESQTYFQVSDSCRETRGDSVDEWLVNFLERAQDPEASVSIEYFQPNDIRVLDEPTLCFNWASLESQYE
ncbi:MAG: hypothetical protein ABL974_10255, partial [Prosthecobacter sp.]